MKCRRINIDLGLHALVINAKYGDTLTRSEIADVCGCTPQFIRNIEFAALGKLKRQNNVKKLRCCIQ